jgi:hypothetical protein
MAVNDVPDPIGADARPRRGVEEHWEQRALPAGVQRTPTDHTGTQRVGYRRIVAVPVDPTTQEQ